MSSSAEQSPISLSPEGFYTAVEAGVGSREKMPKKSLRELTQDVFDALPPSITGGKNGHFDTPTLLAAEMRLSAKLGMPPYDMRAVPERFVAKLRENDPHIHADYTAAFRAIVSSRLVRYGHAARLPKMPVRDEVSVIEKLAHAKPILPGQAIDQSVAYWGTPVQTHLVAESLYETHRQLALCENGVLPFWRFPSAVGLRFQADARDPATASFFNGAVMPQQAKLLSSLQVGSSTCEPPPPPGADPALYVTKETLPTWSLQTQQAHGMQTRDIPLEQALVVAGPMSALLLQSAFAQLRDIVVVGEEGLDAALRMQTVAWHNNSTLQTVQVEGRNHQVWAAHTSRVFDAEDVRTTQMMYAAMQINGAREFDRSGLAPLREKIAQFDAALSG